MRTVSYSIRDLPAGALSTALLDNERVVGVSMVVGDAGTVLSLLVETVLEDGPDAAHPIAEFIAALDGEWLDRMVNEKLQTDETGSSFGQLAADVLREALLP